MKKEATYYSGNTGFGHLEYYPFPRDEHGMILLNGDPRFRLSLNKKEADKLKDLLQSGDKITVEYVYDDEDNLSYNIEKVYKTKAEVSIHTDMDFHAITPMGTCYDDATYKIGAESEEELRNKLVLFLAQIEIRLPYEQEYNAYREDKHDSEFKRTLYEAIHQIASGGSILYCRGGNRTLDIVPT